MPGAFLTSKAIGLAASVMLVAGACTEPATAPAAPAGLAGARAAAGTTQLKAAWCDVHPTCAMAQITLTPGGGRTSVEILFRNLQGAGAPWGTTPWGLQKVRLQLPYGTLGVFPPAPQTSVVVEQGTLGSVAAPVNSPQPWSYTAIAKVAAAVPGMYRDVILLSGPDIAGCDAPLYGVTSYYTTCPDTAVIRFSAPGAWDWKAVTWMWFVGYKQDCALKPKWGTNGQIAGVVLYPSPACKPVAPPP